MTAPPVGGRGHSARRTTNPARSAVKRTNTEGLDPVRVRHLVNAGEWVAHRLGLDMRRRAVRALVVQYLREGCAQDFRVWFLGYADPTGNKAVRNVMRDAS